MQLWGKARRQWLTFLQELRPMKAQPICEKDAFLIWRPFVKAEEAARRTHKLPLYIIAPQRFPMWRTRRAISRYEPDTLMINRSINKI